MAKKTATKARSRARVHEHEETEDGQGTQRAIWSGSVSFGLLQIPVSLHAAEESHELRFHQLDRHDLASIRYQRVNARTGKVVEWKDIVRGYEYAKGKFVVVEDKDLAAANVEATQTIDLQEFIDVKAIPPIFFERPYYLTPGKRADKAYALFREALARKKVVALGTVVIHTRQHLCAIFPQKDVLMLELLRFAHELRGTKGLSVPKSSGASARELGMAEELIESMHGAWHPSKYRDKYRNDVLALVKRKARTGKVEAPARRAPPRSNVVDLMALLRKSVEARGGRADGAKTRSKAKAKPRRHAEAA